MDENVSSDGTYKECRNPDKNVGFRKTSTYNKSEVHTVFAVPASILTFVLFNRTPDEIRDINTKNHWQLMEIPTLIVTIYI